MKIERDAKLLRIFIGETDKIEHVSVYEKIVIEARKFGLAGATVFRGIMGFGGNSRIHTTKVLRLSEDLPLIIEIVDDLKKIQDFIPILDEIFEKADVGGLITIEAAEIIKYTANKNRPAK
jgi:PII-like signaling protein